MPHEVAQPGSLRSQPGKTKFQKQAHGILTEAGYRFVRIDSNEHNLYRNVHGQRCSAVCSPRSPSQALTELRQRIRRHEREREASMPTTAHQTESASRVDIVDQLVALADPSMMKPMARKDTPAGKARIAAFTAWLRRVLEKHAPIHGKHVDEAALRLGFKLYDVVNARKALDVKVMREGGPHGRWLIALPHQVPEGAITRRVPGQEPLGIDVIEPEGPRPDPTDGSMPEPPSPVMPNLSVDVSQKPDPVEQLRSVPASSNGRGQLTDQQAAFLMMAETLGLKVPGQEARLALEQARKAIDRALESLA